MCVRGEIEVVSDKSISHRALILPALSLGESYIENISPSDDVTRTRNILEALGTKIEEKNRGITVRGGNLHEAIFPLYSGNSGTTVRLMMGVVAGLGLFSVFCGDESLSKRPMRRVTVPLSLMGAKIIGRNNANNLPIAVQGGSLKGIRYELPIASAQVKSSILLAGLNAEGKTEVIEPSPTRDHTERLLKFMGARIKKNGQTIIIEKSELSPINLKVPGDFSAAAYFITLALLHPDAELTIKNVNLNPTRTGFLKIIEKMGCSVKITRTVDEPEPVGDIHVKTCKDLHGTLIDGALIPLAIDELPLVAVLGIFAEGETMLENARELRFKESDRINSIVTELKKLGADIEELPDGFIVRKSTLKNSARLSSHNDHRIAMSLAILSALTDKVVEIEGADWVKISFPDFYEKLKEVTRC